MSMLFKRIKDWATSITAFRAGDVIPVDGPSGTAKMSKDALLALVAQPNGTYPYMTAGIAPRNFPYRTGTTTIGGRTYSTVTIGNQEWLNSDLQYNDSGTGIVAATEGTYTGHLYYSWEAATRVSASVGNGWRLPTKDDVNTLFNSVGRSIAGTLLKSTAGWGGGSSNNGKNMYGLDILPTGRTISGTNNNQGWNAYYWTASSSEGAGVAFRFAAVEASAPVFYPENTYCHSIRLVRDTSSNVGDFPAIGSASQPVYVDTDGSVKACNIRFIPVSGSWTAPNVSGDAKFTLYNSTGSSVSLTAGSLSKTLLADEYCDLLAVNGTWKKFSYSYT